MATDSNRFASAVRRSETRGDGLERALAVLDAFCTGVQDGLDDQVRCWRERGYVTNLGQEWRIMMASAAGGPEMVMLRAHVALTGFPVILDLYSESPVECSNETYLGDHLESFLSEPTTQENLELLARGSPAQPSST